MDIFAIRRDKMRILMLNYEYPPVGSGGGIISKYIAEGLVFKGHDLTVLTVSCTSGDQIVEEKNLKLIRLDTGRVNTFKASTIDMIRWNKSAKRYIKSHFSKDSFDLCFANFVMPCGSVAYNMKKQLKIPYVIISHGHDIPWVKPRSLWIYYLATFIKIKKILNKADCLFVQTIEMRRNAERFISVKHHNKIKLIRNGCNPEIFYLDNKKDIQDGIKIIFAGRLVKQKNPQMLIRALGILNDKYKTKFNAEIYGDGKLKNKLLHMIEKAGIRDYIKLSGKVDSSDMPEVFRQGDVFVNTSVSEGMSIAVIEALFSGMYVIATPASGNRELIEKSGMGKIIQFNNPEVLAKELYSISKREKSVAKLNKDFVKEFSWSNIINEYHKALLELSG